MQGLFLCAAAHFILSYVVLLYASRYRLFPLSPGEKNARPTLHSRSATATDTAEAPHTGSIISNGAFAPQAARTAATVDGTICMEAEFSTISVSTASDAPSLPGYFVQP